MTNKGLIITLIGLIAAAAGTIVLIRYLTLPASPQTDLSPVSNEAVMPPTTQIVPRSLTKGVETFTGILSLEKGATFKVDTKIYSLLINKTDAGNTLKAQGYKTGDEVNVMGKVNKEAIEVVGVNKLIK